ncbi:MAG: cytochrome c3 family protein [Desulfobacula sp.]|jgi:predicted CXXCH cytochrome family protein|nr:cytochrome c3 family protein [Desulfobacula sp.]
MKKLFLLMIAGSILLFFSSAWAGIAGTAHDFSGDGWNASGEICIVCHTPHNASTTEQPLWNHEVTGATFTVYTSNTLDAAPGQPAGTSKLCLSCHDGTVALDSYGGGPGTSSSGMITGSELIGTTLANDHPISFVYNDALATSDGGLHPPTTTLSGMAGGGFIEGDFLFGATALATLECSSCHDVHDAAILPDLLRKTNTASALCLTCHAK